MHRTKGWTDTVGLRSWVQRAESLARFDVLGCCGFQGFRTSTLSMCLLGWLRRVARLCFVGAGGRRRTLRAPAPLAAAHMARVRQLRAGRWDNGAVRYPRGGGIHSGCASECSRYFSPLVGLGVSLGAFLCCTRVWGFAGHCSCQSISLVTIFLVLLHAMRVPSGFCSLRTRECVHDIASAAGRNGAQAGLGLTHACSHWAARSSVHQDDARTYSRSPR